MPRDTAGDYQLPAGNPVQPNTLITAAQFNLTMQDIAAALTDSLSRSGKGGLSAPLYFLDGSLSAPGIAFNLDQNTGLFRPADNQIGVTLGGLLSILVDRSFFAVQDAVGTAPTIQLRDQTGTVLATVAVEAGRLVLNSPVGLDLSVDGTVQLPVETTGVASVSIKYDNAASGLTAEQVQAAIDELAVLVGETIAAAAVTYDNTVSGLTADEVQAAIDELAGRTDTLADGISDNAGAIAGNAQRLDDLVAEQVPITAIAGLTATQVQEALEEINAKAGGTVPPATPTEFGTVQLSSALDAVTGVSSKALIPGIWNSTGNMYLRAANPGFYIFSGGLCIQWGRRTTSTVVGNNAVVFPKTYTGVFTVVASPNMSAQIANVFGTNNVTNSGFNFYINAILPGYTWVALGYVASP